MLLKESILLLPVLDIREISQIAERTSPNFLSLFLALGLGIAGAISIIRNAGSAFVGVAIAIALVPPAATSGWVLPLVAVAAAVLVLVNLLAVNVSALIMFWVSGFRPVEKEAVVHARSSVISHVALLVIAIASLSVALGLVTYSSFQTILVEQEINGE
ncbi:DUF389 domain-containing protein [Methanosarcina barkeri]